MAGRSRPSFTKRLKERARQEKQREKAERKQQRKQEKLTPQTEDGMPDTAPTVEVEEDESNAAPAFPEHPPAS
jgi:hypothetical protein